MPEQFLHGVEVVEIDNGLRPIQTVKSSIIGFVGTAPDADAAIFPENQPVLVTGPRMAENLGATGTLRDAYLAAYAQGVSVAIVVRVPKSEDAAETKANVLGDATAYSGVYALLAAASVTGQTPRILAAPGWTSGDPGDGVNPVVSALLTVAAKLRAVVIKDGPNTTEADAITDAGLYGDGRLYIVDPAVRAFDTTAQAAITKPASAYVAGLLSKRDQERGFWWSPSNQEVRGITGTARPIGFAMSEAETESNRLNEAKVATIVRRNGFRLWGNRSASSDALWAFLSVRRTADMIYESVEEAHLWAMDRPMSAQLLLDIRDSVQAYLDTLVTRGAILGGTVWLDPELNTEATLKAGQLFLDFDIEPPAPLERLTFRAHRNGSYYEELVAQVVSA
ncbi:Putative prophage major tail sheath protein [Roseibaca ekhonensis]|uniref:Prophage major tail sheath protein n=1 Tax=Roseinatronobacter ekhonensis TaxID=254356 RepID=A0A3B0MCP0_9RHOB|nr:phage tail sheath subtilisin-like domain-containing protein [Roseibaca ekhonensis]SUZ33621.1 Putative prophage major tail sheath protein [Roseibaca ekhonensis]